MRTISSLQFNTAAQGQMMLSVVEEVSEWNYTEGESSKLMTWTKAKATTFHDFTHERLHIYSLRN